MSNNIGYWCYSNGSLTVVFWWGFSGGSLVVESWDSEEILTSYPVLG